MKYMRQRKMLLGKKQNTGATAFFLKKINTPFIAFMALFVIYVAFSFFKVQQFKQLPNFNAKDDTALFWTESAFQYRYAKIVADGGIIPDVDSAAQFPEGARPHKEFTLFMEYVAGYIYKIFFGNSTAVPFHLFLIFFISFYSSLTIIAVYLLGKTLWGDSFRGLFGVVFYLIARISWARTVGGFNYEDFALPLIFFSLVFFIKAVKAQMGSKGRVWSSVLSAVFLFAALTGWHFSRFYFLIFSSVITAAFFTQYDADTPLHVPIVVALIVSIIGGIFSPVLRATNFLFSMPMLVLFALFIVSSLKNRLGFARTNAILVFLGLLVLFISCSFLSLKNDVGEYFHVYSLFLYKLKYLLVKPDNPLLLPFDTRILWIEAFNSPGVYDWLSQLSVLLPLGLIPVIYEIRETYKKPTNESFLFCGLALSFLFLSLFAIRLISFVAVFLSVYVGKYPEILDNYGVSSRKVIYAFLVLSLLLAPGSYKIIALLNPPPKSVPTFQESDTKYVVDWIRENTKSEDVFLSNIGVGAVILAYTGRAVNLQPKFENAYIRRKVKEFAYALYEQEDGFYKLCHEYGTTYFLYENPFLFNHSKESYRYYANSLKLNKEAVAYKFNFEPEKLKFFDLVFQTNSYRIYKIRSSDEKKYSRTWGTVSYNPIYDPAVFSVKSGEKCFDDKTVPLAFSKILHQIEIMGNGIREMNAGNYYSAKDYMTQAISILPNPLIHFQLGNVNYFLGNYDSAIADYKIALDYSGEIKPELLNNIATAYSKKGDYSNTMEYKRKSSEILPNKISSNAN